MSALTENEWEDTEARAERFDDAKEELTTERDREIRDQLRAGGDAYDLLPALFDEEWSLAIEALIHKAADPLPLLPEQFIAIGVEFARMTNVAIGRAAVPSDRQVQMRVDEDARSFA